jgi:hypothetical protein
MSPLANHSDADREHRIQERLIETQVDYLAARRDLDNARSERDDAILEAADLGLSRREVARLTGVSAGRIQQVIDARAKHVADRWQRLMRSSNSST